MKQAFTILVIVLSLLSCKKDPDPTELDVVLTEHPTGGSGIRSVSVSFDAHMKGEVKPIELTIEWCWENGFHTNQKIVESERITINIGGVTSKSIVYSTAPGYHLLNYYWARITWTDDKGQHEVVSSKAYCSSK